MRKRLPRSQSTPRHHDPEANVAPGSIRAQVILTRSSAQMEKLWYECARYVPAITRCCPRIAPVGKRRPGGRAAPDMELERSVMVKSFGRGPITSSSRLTSVNYHQTTGLESGHVLKNNKI